jgi:hypothetical protein
MVLKFILFAFLFSMFPIALISMAASVLFFILLGIIWFIFAISMIVVGASSLVGILLLLPIGLEWMESLLEINMLEAGVLLALSIYEFYGSCYQDILYYNPANFLY